MEMKGRIESAGCHHGQVNRYIYVGLYRNSAYCTLGLGQGSSGFVSNAMTYKITSSELLSCAKIKAAILGFPSLIVLMVSVDIKPYGMSLCNNILFK